MSENWQPTENDDTSKSSEYARSFLGSDDDFSDTVTVIAGIILGIINGIIIYNIFGLFGGILAAILGIVGTMGLVLSVKSLLNGEPKKIGELIERVFIAVFSGMTLFPIEVYLWAAVKRFNLVLPCIAIIAIVTIGIIAARRQKD